MSVVISDEMLRAAQLDEAEFRVELAIWLYQQQRLSLEQAIEWSGVDRLEFQRRLRERDIPIHYDEADLEQDLQAIADLRAQRQSYVILRLWRTIGASKLLIGAHCNTTRPKRRLNPERIAR